MEMHPPPQAAFGDTGAKHAKTIRQRPSDQEPSPSTLCRQLAISTPSSRAKSAATIGP